jgi:hypothetical protein
MNTFLSYIQDFNVGASSTMNAPFIQGEYTNVTMPRSVHLQIRTQWLLHTYQDGTQVS